MSASLPPPPRAGLFAWLPGLWVARHYDRAWLARDIGAGLALTALLVPAGMGYAEASGLPAVTGLYASILPLLAYALFGPSRILVLGPDSGLTALIAAVVVAKAGGDVPHAVAVAAVLALLTGAFCVVAGFLRAGSVAELLSKPVRVGYMNGIALTMLVAQLPKLFGFAGGANELIGAVRVFASGVLEGRTNVVALVIGAGSLGLILVTRRFAPRFPAVLAAVTTATVGVALLGLEGRVTVIGALPRGLPAPAFPPVHASELGDLAIAALGIALVSFADTSVLSRTFASRTGTRVDSNRELVALGIANVASGLFGGFPVSSSASRTPVAEAAGSRTQLTGVVAALAILALLLVAPALLHDLPTSVLAAIVVAAALHLFDFRTLRASFRVRRSDFVLSLIAFAAVAVLGVTTGIAIAVAVSLLDVLRRSWHPHDAILGRAPGLKGYHDVAWHPEARQIPDLVLFRWDAPLFFANADAFRKRVMDAVDAAHPKWVVIAAEPITDVDTTAAEMLGELAAELQLRQITLAFAELKDPVRETLRRYGLEATIRPEHFFPTLGVAVKRHVEQNGVVWSSS